ncbi:MAG: BlaI/MecI/CopY family transcriptional regulator [Alicyclobacillus sp.]|nr:BlaI/MecI/CopY family transcriptional regulator [Alicyclobacillus sp.]
MGRRYKPSGRCNTRVAHRWIVGLTQGDAAALVPEPLDEPAHGQFEHRLGPDHNYKTVMTVMNRLAQKRVLVRRKVSKAFYYTAAVPREQFLRSVSRSVIGSLISDFGPTAIAQFVDVVGELGPDELAELDRLIHQKESG